MYIVRDNKVTIIKILVKRLPSCLLNLTSAGGSRRSRRSSAPSLFFPRKEPMFKLKENKAKDTVDAERKPPIVFVPDPSYIDREGNLIPINVKVCASMPLYEKVEGILSILDGHLTEEKEVDDGNMSSGK